MRNVIWLAAVIVLLCETSRPSRLDAQQQRSTGDFLDAMLRDVREFRTEQGTALTRGSLEIAVDLTGLDTALVSLGIARSVSREELQRRNPEVRVARYSEVASCRVQRGLERCVLPPGVTGVRFFSPRAVGRDTVTFLLGTYERRSGKELDPGTAGVVYEVVARRGSDGWQIVSAKPKYVS